MVKSAILSFGDMHERIKVAVKESNTLAQVEEYPEPFPYGDDFESIRQLFEVVDARREQGLQVYGHAICYIDSKRIAARVGFNGDITVGAHCEYI